MSIPSTALYDRHVSAGARIVPFAGWEMPVQYSGIRQEHTAVRTHAGLFDVSHMGQLEFHGNAGFGCLQRLTTSDVSKLRVGRCQYSFFVNEAGGTVDDAMVYRVEEDRILVVVNASNTEKIESHVRAHLTATEEDAVRNSSEEWNLIALQGPEAREVLRGLGTPEELVSLPFHAVAPGELLGVTTYVAASGYTGENGYEIFVKDGVETVWDGLVDAGGASFRLCGLGARDTLRLEASLALYGHELDEETTPIEAGLGFAVSSGDYLGSDVLARQKESGPAKRLVSLVLADRAIPRQGCPVESVDGEVVGIVTSGTMAPWLNKPIAMAYVQPGNHGIGTRLNVDVRGRKAAGKVVKRPFYKRPAS